MPDDLLPSGYLDVHAGFANMPPGDEQWRAPGSGTPLKPAEVDAKLSSIDIANRVANRLLVPKGPIRTVSAAMGITGIGVGGLHTPVVPTFIAAALNSAIELPILAGPGVITHMDVTFACITTGAAAGILFLYDMDVNNPLLRQFVVNTGTAGNITQVYAVSPDENLPFLAGILAAWKPIVAAFGNSIISVNIDFQSIPIGQRPNV